MKVTLNLATLLTVLKIIIGVALITVVVVLSAMVILKEDTLTEQISFGIMFLFADILAIIGVISMLFPNR